MFSQDELLPISALQHLSFCERQWGLIHLEGVWEENLFTAQGRLLHDRAHEPHSETRGNTRIARGLRLRSLALGVTGVADVVEFHKLSEADESENIAVHLPGRSGLWKPFPVEYKRGKPKKILCDEVQLCAQAICLEEMLDVIIHEGSLFYGKTKRRHDVEFNEQLRKYTHNLAERLHDLSEKRKTPPPEFGKKCDSCSLKDLCLPETSSGQSRVKRYIDASLKSSIEQEENP